MTSQSWGGGGNKNGKQPNSSKITTEKLETPWKFFCHLCSSKMISKA